MSLCVCIVASRYIAKQTASRLTIEKKRKNNFNIFPFLSPSIPMIRNTHKQSEKKKKKKIITKSFFCFFVLFLFYVSAAARVSVRKVANLLCSIFQLFLSFLFFIDRERDAHTKSNNFCCFLLFRDFFREIKTSLSGIPGGLWSWNT